VEACTGGANPCMTKKNCISCQLASWRCLDRARKAQGRGGVGLGQEKVAQTSWLTYWCTYKFRTFDRCMGNRWTRRRQKDGCMTNRLTILRQTEGCMASWWTLDKV
jgi:hypothetical protein